MKCRSFFPILLVLLSTLTACRAERGKRIVIGSKNFTEQNILGEIIALQLEANTGLAVDRRFNLGGTFICHEAIRAGEIDIYIEYTGTALTAILKRQPQNDPQLVYRIVRDDYDRLLGLRVGPALGFNNTFAVIVRAADAQKWQLQTISDVARVTPGWRAGFGYEFLERQDGYEGLAEVYGLQFAEAPRVMELGLMYRALSEKKVDLVAGNSTDGVISKLGLVILEDDRQYFPPYYAIPIVAKDVWDRLPELRFAIEALANTIDDDEMRRLNHLVDGDQHDVRSVAVDFLRAAGLVGITGKQ